MRQSQIKEAREKRNISLLTLAARTGLLSDYLQKIEEEIVPALESDIERIRKAIEEIT